MSALRGDRLYGDDDQYAGRYSICRTIFNISRTILNVQDPIDNSTV